MHLRLHTYYVILYNIIFLVCVSSQQLKTAIETELRAHSMQVNTNAVTKVIQLYETKTSRHAVMIVGQTQAAKTVTWRVLQASMTRLNRDGDINFQAVKVKSCPS